MREYIFQIIRREISQNMHKQTQTNLNRLTYIDNNNNNLVSC